MEVDQFMALHEFRRLSPEHLVDSYRIEVKVVDGKRRARATQGHSSAIDDDAAFPLCCRDSLPPKLYHVTKSASWECIAIDGLKCGREVQAGRRRRHVYLTSDEEYVTRNLQDDETILGVDTAAAFDFGVVFRSTKRNDFVVGQEGVPPAFVYPFGHCETATAAEAEPAVSLPISENFVRVFCMTKGCKGDCGVLAATDELRPIFEAKREL